MFLPYVITHDICDCGKPMYRKTKGRTSFAEELTYCPACKHDETPECLCKNCILKRKNELEARKVQFYKTWESYYDLIKQNLELIADELFNHYSLSKTYRLIYYGIQRTLTHKAKYSTTTKSSNSYLRNLMLSIIEKYNLPEHKPNLKDFNPVELSESYFTHYIKRYI